MLAVYKEDKYKVNCPSFKYHIENGISTPYTGDLEIISGYFKNKSKRSCLDIGAHIGTHSVPFSRIFDQVYSFEVNPDNYQFLEENIKLNERENIKPYQTPLLDVIKKIKIVRHSNDNTGCFTTEETKDEGIESNFVDNLNIDEIDFIKIDVEGKELQVLKGAEKSIEKWKPMIQLEMNYLSKDYHKEILDFFRTKDYIKYNSINNDVFFYHSSNKKKIIRVRKRP